MTRLPLCDVACPVCGSSDARQKRAAAYPEGMNLEAARCFYSASSDHALLDRVAQCRSCGMIYVSPRLDAALIESGYEAGDDPMFVQQNAQRIRTFARAVRGILSRTGIQPAGKRLLDVGCAGGAFPAAARDAGFAVEGIEPNRWLGQYAQTTYGIPVHQGVLKPGMFPPESFDVVTIWDVIEHLADPHDALRNIRALLRPDGYLWLNYPDAGSIMARLLGWRWPFWLSVHLHYYTRRTIESQLRRAAFTVCYTRAHWQELQLGYVLRRAAAVVPPARYVGSLVRGLGMEQVPVLYNLGQRLVIAKPHD